MELFDTHFVYFGHVILGQSVVAATIVSPGTTANLVKGVNGALCPSASANLHYPSMALREYTAFYHNSILLNLALHYSTMALLHST